MTNEEAIHDIEKCVIPYVGGISLRMAVEALKAQRRGEWKEKPRYEGDDQPDLECPFCGYSIEWWNLGYYCAKCGARLTGSAVDDDVMVEGDEE